MLGASRRHPKCPAAASLTRFGPDKTARFEALVARYGQPDLPGLAERYGHEVR